MLSPTRKLLQDSSNGFSIITDIRGQQEFIDGGILTLTDGVGIIENSLNK